MHGFNYHADCYLRVLDSPLMGSAEFSLLFVQVWAPGQNRQNSANINLRGPRSHSSGQDVLILWCWECWYYCHIYDAGIPIHKLLLQLPRRTTCRKGKKLIYDQAIASLRRISGLRSLYSLMPCRSCLLIQWLSTISLPHRNLQGCQARICDACRP